MGEQLQHILNSPEGFLLALLFASTLALGACLWLVWSELRRLAAREQKSRRESAEQIETRLAALKEKLDGEMARQRRETEQIERNLEAAVRRRLEELQALLESLRAIEAKLHGRVAPPAGEPPSSTVSKEARAGFSVIARPPKAGGGEPQG